MSFGEKRKKRAASEIAASNDLIRAARSQANYNAVVSGNLTPSFAPVYTEPDKFTRETDRWVSDGGGRKSTARSIVDIQTDLNILNSREKALQREQSILLAPDALTDNSSRVEEIRKEIEELAQKRKTLETEKYVEEIYASKGKRDSFSGQFDANMELGRIVQDQGRAWNDYLENPTEANRKRAELYDQAVKAFQTRNYEALDDKGQVAPLLSKDLANYLPQLVDQTKSQAAGAIAGGVIGGLATGGAGTLQGIKIGSALGSGKKMFEVTRGAAFKRLLDLGVDEALARDLANDEGIVSGLIESADTYLEWALMGGSKALTSIGSKIAPELTAKATTSAGKSALKKLTDKVPALVKALAGYALNIPQEGVEEGWQEGVSLATDARGKAGADGSVPGLFVEGGKAALDPENREQVWEATKGGMKIAAMVGGAQVVTNQILASGSKPETKTTVDKQVDKVDNKPIQVSEAASETVKQVAQQEKITRAENPESNVLDTATTLIMERQGLSLKVAQTRAEIMQKLIAGEEVKPRDLNRIEPTSPKTKAIFTELSGVQFPDGVSGETLFNLYRSAPQVAKATQEARVAEAEQAVARAQEVVAQEEARAEVQAEMAEDVGLYDANGQSLLTPEQFATTYQLTPEEAAERYPQYLYESATIEFKGQRVNLQQFTEIIRHAPDGDKLDEDEIVDYFRNGLAREQQIKEAQYGRQQGTAEPNPVQRSAGSQGQSGQRTGMDAGSLAQDTGRAGSESGQGGEYGTRPQDPGEDVRGHGEGSRGSVNSETTIREAKSADGRTVFNEISESAWTDEMREQNKKFARAGVTLRAAQDAIPIPGTNRSCDGVSLLGIESIVQTNSELYTFNQLCDHESAHQYFFRDSALFDKCRRELKMRTTRKQRQELLRAYLGQYADVYATADAKTQEKLRAEIFEEVICDAYAGMNRAGAEADRLQVFIKPIIDQWAAKRDAEMESAEKRYSIDSMAESVGLTFEKDGQMTVFKDAKGNRVNEVSEQMIEKSPLGAVIQSAVDADFISQEDAAKQVKFFSDLFNLMIKTQDIDLLWAVSASIGFQPIESGARDASTINQKSRFAGYTKNSDPQYSTTVDFTTICLKTQAVIDAMSETMMQLGQGLTEEEIVDIVYRNTHEAGEPVPCPVCYVFSRWVGLGGLFDNMNQLQNQYANADPEVLRGDMALLEERINEIMAERGYALQTGKKGTKSYVLPGTSSKKSFGDAKTIMYKDMVTRQTELQSKKNQDTISGKKTMTKAENAELEQLKKDINILDNWTWLNDVRLSDNYEPVPPEILFNINAGKEFAEQYPESWKYRTTRGPAMGKAATPYADEHLGQILRGAGISDLKGADLGNPAKNPFLSANAGKLTPAARKALQKSRAKIKAQNLLNGQRYQSTSDFRFEYALDYLLSFIEMQALGGKVQLYTKVAEAVRMFASVGAEVNCSLMPLGIGYRVNKDGSKTLTFSSVTGMNAEDAFNLSSEFDNVQPIMVGVGNEHIRLCMADDRISFIIPYHASGAGESRYVALMDIVGESVESREDYSAYQTDHKIENPTKEQKAAYDLRMRLLTGKMGMLKDADKQVLRNNEILHNLYKRFYGKDVDGNLSDIDPKYLSPEIRESGKLFRDNECYGVFLTKEQAGTVMPFEYWDRTSTIENADVNGQAFAEYCESLGLRPRFSGWDGNGKYHAETDFSKESGYWKMLIDRRCYNRDGSYHEQQTIDATNFDADFLLRDKAVEGIVQPSLVNDPAKTAKIAAKSVEEVKARRSRVTEGKRFSADAENKNQRPYSYEALVQKPDVVVTQVPMRDVPTKGKRLDVSKIAAEGRNLAKVATSQFGDQRYVEVPDLGVNVLVSAPGVRHGLTGNKTNSGTMATAEVTYVLPDILRNSVAVNELNPRSEADGEFSYVLFGFAERTDGKQYLVKSTVNHFADSRSAVEDVEIYDILKGIKARKMEAGTQGSHTDHSAASLPNGTTSTDSEVIRTVPQAEAGFYNASESTISVAELLEIVKENYPELLPKSVREHFGIDEPAQDPSARYSITPEFEKWYKEQYGEEDVTDAQLKRRLETQERRAEQAEESAKAAEFKRVMDTQNGVAAWSIYHQKKMREQKRVADAKLAAARKEKVEAVRSAVAETKVIERAKAEVQHDADRMAERRNAAKRLRTQENAYKQKVGELKENAKLKRNAAKATLRDKRLADRKRAEIESEQGLVDTIRKSPKQRSQVERIQESAQNLRTLGRSAYRNFVNVAEAIDRFSKRQVSDMRAGTLVNVVGSSASTTEAIFKTGLVNRAGDRIGDSMRDVFLCWDDAHKNVDENKQALLQDFMLHWHNIDRMSIVTRAEARLETFELNNEWLRDMDTKEFARLVAMTGNEAAKLGKEAAQQKAFEYQRLIREYNEAANKPIFADADGKAVTAETSQKIVDKYLDENPWLLEKSKGIHEWWDLFMKNWAVGDTLSGSEYLRMRDMYPHYVPTYRADKNGVGGANFVGLGGANVSKAVKRAKGSFAEVVNIEDSFANMVSKIVKLNRVNELYMNIIDTAMLDEDGVFADLAYFDWDSSWQTGAYAEALGSELTETVDDADKAGLEKVGNDYKLTAWREGRKLTAFISEDLYKSIGGVTGHLANDLEQNLLKVGNALTGPMKTAITGINPNFALRNISRDLPTAIVNSISGMAFPKYWARAAAEMSQNSEHWQHFKALGGTNATYYNDGQGFAKAIAAGKGVVAKTVDKVGWFNEVTEAQTRFAEYLATVDRLGDTYEARLQGIKNSAEVTVDFSRKGRYGKVINAWVPYWNPAVQGIDKVARSVIESPDGSAVWKQASKTLGRAAMTTVLLEAILHGVLKALDRDDEWEELNDRTKDTYYCIPLKDSHTFLKIPKNREWGAILGTPFMRMLEYANGRENPFENYIETAIEPNFLPPAILRPDAGGGFSTDMIGFSQMNDLSKNEDFAGRAIVPYAYQQGSPSQQYDADTSWVAKKLGDLFNWSPMQIDYLIGDYFGDFGDIFRIATSDAIWSGDKDVAEAALDVVASPWTVDSRYSNQGVSKYYDTMDDLKMVVNDKKNQLGNEAYKQTVEYQTQKAVTDLYGDQISELNRIVRELPDGPDKDAAKAQIAQLTGEALQYYDDCMAGRISNPVLDAEYKDFSGTVSKELIRLDSLSGEYKFKPTGNPSAKYTDPQNKQREYVLDDAQKDYFKQLYREKYDELFLEVIQSGKYLKAKDADKATMLEDTRDDVLDATKEEFFDWLRKNGVRSIPKTKK